MKKFIIGLFIISLLPAFSQKIQYGGLQQVGLVFGERSVNLAFSMVNGIRTGKIFAGIGADMQFRHGYSYIPINTSAVYLDARYYINKKKNFFAKLDGGVNLVSQKVSTWYGQKQKNLTGYYSAAGIGFKARLGQEVFYTFDVSYMMRQTRFNISYPNFRDEIQTEKYNYLQYAIMVNMGFEIF